VLVRADTRRFEFGVEKQKAPQTGKSAGLFVEGILAVEFLNGKSQSGEQRASPRGKGGSGTVAWYPCFLYSLPKNTLNSTARSLSPLSFY